MASSSPQASSLHDSQRSTESPQPSEVRNRRSMFSGSVPPISGAFPDDSSRARSPASSSTIFSSPVTGPRLADPPSRTPQRGSSTPLRKSVIKADISITSTFDPADAELYALWAPAR